MKIYEAFDVAVNSGSNIYDGQLLGSEWHYSLWSF